MTIFATLAAILAVQSGIGAPADVPKGHWAFTAVDELFKARLLDGYPAQAGDLKLIRGLKKDSTVAERLLKRWRSNGLLVGYPEGMLHGEISFYEYAVAAHAVRTNIETIAKEGPSSPDYIKAIDEIPSVVRMFSMLEPELTRMGATVEADIELLNKIWQTRRAPYRG
jgi:hypothetical protein